MEGVLDNDEAAPEKFGETDLAPLLEPLAEHAATNLAHRHSTGISPSTVTGQSVSPNPGYRVYCSQRGNVLLLLLAGGEKSTQQKDIERSIRLTRAQGEEA